MSVKILIIDDERIIIDSCSRILSNDDYQIDAAQDGIEGLRKIDENRYDIVILDIMMPNIDGLEVLHRITGGRHPRRLARPDFFQQLTPRAAASLEELDLVLRTIRDRAAASGTAERGRLWATRPAMVVLPAPVSPTNATVSPASTSRSI